MLSLNKIGIISAVKEEVADILQNRWFEWKDLGKGLHSSPRGVVLSVTGIGKVHSAYGLAKIIDSVGEIFIVGTSGGLGEEKIGDVYVSTEFVEHDMDAEGLGCPAGVTPFSYMKSPIISHYEQSMIDRLTEVFSKNNLVLKFARTMSGDQFINDQRTIDKKVALFKTQLVDMESAGIAKLCMMEKKPVVALRYVTDNANHESHTSWTENVKHSSKIMNSLVHGYLTLS